MLGTTLYQTFCNLAMSSNPSAAPVFHERKGEGGACAAASWLRFKYREGSIVTTRLFALTLLLAACGTEAIASPYWVAYEGDDFPENVGWTRYNFGVGPAERSITDGVFTIDSRASFQISDFYQIDRQLNPSPGEHFIAEWRLRILSNEPATIGDAGVVIARDGEGTLAFQIGVDRITSSRENWSHPIDPLIFHTYRLESADMVQYQLWIDSSPVHTGTWDLNSLNASFFNFGDGVRGARSLQEWDFVRFGVVPEPNSGLACATGLSVFVMTKRRFK